MRKPTIDLKIFSERRKILGSRIQGAALVIPAHPEYVRNHDVHFDYRQDTNLFYLTGFEEPESVFVFRPGQNPETVLFVRSKDPLRETWDGFRYGPEGAQKEFGIDKTYTIDDLDSALPDLLKSVDKIYYRLLHNRDFDKRLSRAMEAVKQSRGRSGSGLQTIVDSTEILGEMRIKKSAVEIEWQAKACEITARGHLNAMKAAKPGMTERQLQAVLQYTYLNENSTRMGYNPIVAGGDNAVTLHYNFNDQVCKDGDLVLIDMGTEWNYFTGDITRTFPVNGRFSAAQAELYRGVLEIQKKIIEMVKPGVYHKDLQNKTIEWLTDLMFDTGLLKGDKAVAINELSFKKYYPHGVSHWLGMDVHDAGLYSVGGEGRRLEQGMVLTIEPGIYVRSDDTSAPKEFRGIGIRIEDNILVTETGNRNLTALAPKEIKDMESVIGTGFSV